MTVKPLRLWSLFFVFVFATGCSTARYHMPDFLRIKGEKGFFMEGRIIDVRAGRAISFDSLVAKLSRYHIIFIGENHDNPEHHLIEIQILQAMCKEQGHLLVAMEFFPYRVQRTIDDYMGNRLSEQEFLKRVHWEKFWGFPYHLYRPLILEAKEKGIRIIGINVPRAVVRKVARQGLESLTAKERKEIAKKIYLRDKDHRKYLEEIYHRHKVLGLDNFEFFYQAQCVWEDSMAERVAACYEEERKRTLVFCGNGHIINKFGIPSRVSRRIDAKVATVVLFPLEEKEEIDKDFADFVWVTGNSRVRNFPVHMPPVRVIKR